MIDGPPGARSRRDQGIHSTTEREDSSFEIDRNFGDPQGGRAHQSVESWFAVSAVADQKSGPSAELCFADSQAGQPNLFPLEFANGVGRSVSADLLGEAGLGVDGSNRISEEARYLRSNGQRDDSSRHSTIGSPALSCKGSEFARRETEPKTNFARNVVDFKGALAQNVQTQPRRRCGPGELFERRINLRSGHGSCRGAEGQASRLGTVAWAAHAALHDGDAGGCLFQMKLSCQWPVQNGGAGAGIHQKVESLERTGSSPDDDQIVAIEIEPDRLSIRISLCRRLTGHEQNRQKTNA